MLQVNPTSVFAARAAPSRAQAKPTILVAEDSADGREMLQVLLRLKGYEVFSAENGVRAMEEALAHCPDLILLDLELPRLDGLTLTKTLRSRREFRTTPIIMVSGHDPLKLRQPALEAGCTDYLLKPIDFEQLDSILKAKVPLP